MSVQLSFERLVRDLKREFPPIYPARVYKRKLDDSLGYTEFTGASFIVVVNSPMCWQAQWQVLIHEWAHVISWREGHETVCDHDPEWALSLSRIYQQLIEP